MRDERPDADHVEIEMAERIDVPCQRCERLAGDADHHAAADLVAKLAQLPENGNPVGDPARQGRMDECVEVRVGGLEAKQIAIGARLAPRGEVLGWPLADAQRDGQRRLAADAAHDAREPFSGDAVVLARLHHDRAVAEADGLAGAGENLVLGHAVTLDAGVGRADAAVGAGSDAVIGDFDQAAQVDFVADIAASGPVGRAPELLQPRGVGLAQPALDLVEGHLAVKH